ncbi:hypothetical protein SAMN04490240_2735 [Rhodococcus pyridinivorans]|uniref:DUF5994 family protein n=1 Tax=Rhodococcus pyridinivorans TaxID=103816 RepID=UPI0007CD78E0|nr:DUF5994 family protein [Rhodococcus pyridinivorans]SEC93029.1 hypothetical protein SAMN04490240_2735 [Rhodococcus pyridinivorans]
MSRLPRRLFTNRDLGRFRAAADGGQPFDAPTRTVRLLLRDPDEHSAGVDGAWWPRGDNVTAELHNLVSALTSRLGRTERIAFDWNALSISQRGIDPPDGLDFVGPAPDQPRNQMYVFGRDGTCLRLLIIEPMLDADRAYEDMQKTVAPNTEQA